MITGDPTEAARLVSSGAVVLLVIPEGATYAGPDGPGRLAIFVGDIDDPTTRAAAEEMVRELFKPS